MINALNFSTILAQGGNNGAYTGATWPLPTAATSGRYFRLGTEINF